MQDKDTDEAPSGNTPEERRTGALTASAEFRNGDPNSLVKDPKLLLRPARFLVLITLAMALAGLGSNALELQFFLKVETGAFVSDREMMAAAEANDQRQIFVFVPYLVIAILTIIFVGRWIYFSSKNLRVFGAVGLEIRPGWAVGWYFVPIANLWKPYQAMKEIWQASSDPLNWWGQPTPGLMPAWWSLWLIATISDRVASRLVRYADTIADLQFAAVASMASGAVYVAACAVFVILMNRVSRLQTEAMEHKSTLAVFGP